MDFILASLSSAAAATVMLAALAWLFKSWIGERLKNAIKHEYDMALEAEKAKLKATYDLELEAFKGKLTLENTAAIERLKNELQTAVNESQVRFTSLHAKVAKMVAGLYAHLYLLTQAVEYYVSELETPGSPSKRERRMAVGEAMKEFTDYFRPRMLYMSRPLAAQVKAYTDKLYRWANDFKVGVEEGGDERFTDRDTWRRVVGEIRDEVPQLFGSLEEEFRKLLGVQPV